MQDSRVRVLVINPKLPVAVGIKTAFDALGGFDARPFTSPVNALEYARTSPPDAAVIDLMTRSPGIVETSIALRKLNPKLKLLLTNAPDEAVKKLRADGVISLPPRAREIEPMLRTLFPHDADGTPSRRPQELRSNAPSRPTSDTPTLSSRDSAKTKPARDESPTLSSRESVQEELPDALEQDDPFERIAGEEPPVPTGMEGGTVREAVRAMLPRQPLDESMYVVEITPRPSDTDEDEPIPGSGEWRALTPAEAMQEEALAAEGDAEDDEDASEEPIEAVSPAPDEEILEEAAEEPGDAPDAAVEPVTPDDLSERLAAEEPEVPKNETAAPTKRNNGIKVPALPPVRPILPTDKMPRVQPSKAVEPPKPIESVKPPEPIKPAEPIKPPVARSFDDSDADLDEPPTLPAKPAAPAQSKPDTPPVVIPGQRRPAKQQDEPATSEAQEAPQIVIPGQRRPPKKQDAAPSAAEPQPDAPAAAAPHRVLSSGELRKALMLTHQQIGTTAAALILTEGSDILAHSGEMPTQEIEELERVIGGDWEVRGTNARVRYITLPTSRQEYMLHTRRTENGYVLSMAFAGDLAVSEIRIQSDAVAETLHSMRPASGDTADAEPDASLVGLTAVWMLDNPTMPLTADVAQAVVIEFDRQLRELGWTVHAMNVHADFIYVYCDVQTTYLASEVIAELKRISADAACSRRPGWSPDELWADAYMVLMPGRELGSDEVESFLTFTRARLHRKAN